MIQRIAQMKTVLYSNTPALHLPGETALGDFFAEAFECITGGDT